MKNYSDFLFIDGVAFCGYTEEVLVIMHPPGVSLHGQPADRRGHEGRLHGHVRAPGQQGPEYTRPPGTAHGTVVLFSYV